MNKCNISHHLSDIVCLLVYNPFPVYKNIFNKFCQCSSAKRRMRDLIPNGKAMGCRSCVHNRQATTDRNMGSQTYTTHQPELLSL